MVTIAEGNFLSRESPEKIYASLNENYSCCHSYVAAGLHLVHNLHDYSLSIESLSNVTLQKTPGGRHLANKHNGSLLAQIIINVTPLQSLSTS